MSTALVDRLLAGRPEDAVLGLGEPTHGTAEAFSLKLAVIQELARTGRLAMLAVEESFTVGLQVDAALRGGGDLDAAWDPGSSIWDTRTIREGLRTVQRLVGALEEARRPRFLGVDISKPYRTARALLARGAQAPELATCRWGCCAAKASAAPWIPRRATTTSRRCARRGDGRGRAVRLSSWSSS